MSVIFCIIASGGDCLDKFIIMDFVSILNVNDDKGRVTEFESRYSDCFIITLDGKIQFTFDNTSLIAGINTPVYLPKGLKYRNTCLESAESIVVNFHTSATDKMPRNLRRIEKSVALKYSERICTYSESSDSSLLLYSELYSLAALLLKDDTHSSPQKSIVNSAISFINSNYETSSLAVNDIACHCGVSEIYLRKLFNCLVGKSPYAFLTSVRMNAAYLLCLEKRPVKEIAASVGYSDVYSFSRAFKKHFGFPPSET